jgi:hypothetical protein
MAQGIPERDQEPLEYNILSVPETLSAENVLARVPEADPVEAEQEPVVVIPKDTRSLLQRVPDSVPSEADQLLDKVPDAVPEYSEAQEPDASPVMTALRALDPYHILKGPLQWHNSDASAKAKAANMVAISDLMGVTPSQAAKRLWPQRSSFLFPRA